MLYGLSWWRNWISDDANHFSGLTSIRLEYSGIRLCEQTLQELLLKVTKRHEVYYNAVQQ